MAKMNSPFSFRGPLGNLSVYYRSDLQMEIIRGKGGASREKILHDPCFENSRRGISEFKGCSTTAAAIGKTFVFLKPFGGYSQSGKLGSELRPVQTADTQSEWGKRSVQLSKHPRLLEGFNLSKKHLFEAVVRHPLSASIDRETLSATVQLPTLVPGLNFFPKGNYPLFRIAATLGLVPDHFFALPKYKPQGDYSQLFPQLAQTEWLTAQSGLPATTLELALPYTPPNDDFSLVLTVGVQMGTLGAGGAIEGVKYSGGAKILAVG